MNTQFEALSFWQVGGQSCSYYTLQHWAHENMSHSHKWQPRLPRQQQRLQGPTPLNNLHVPAAEQPIKRFSTPFPLQKWVSTKY